MSDATVAKALAAWGLEQADCRLVAQRENTVFRIRDASGTQRALRLHRRDYQTKDMIESELRWMRHLGSEGLNVPIPQCAASGVWVIEVDGHHADVLSWLDGTPMGATGQSLDLADRTGTFCRIGRLMARLHKMSDDWKRPKGFVRQSWDIDGLLGDAPLWNRFWDNPGLSRSERDLLLAARDRLRSDLSKQALDFGLIHADVVRENILIDGTSLGLIDFDDSGFGFRLFDVATALFKNRAEPDFDDLQAAFLDGYRGIRPLETQVLPQFMLVRALSYLGWIMPRMNEPGAQLRQERFRTSSLQLVNAYLAST